uniref:F-box domain-containing protein n=1 Tax=Aegilops tauschii TaxID=37682 RepID=M8BPM2_AEGTA
MADVAKTYESGDGSVTTNDRGAVEGDDGWQAIEDDGSNLLVTVCTSIHGASVRDATSIHHGSSLVVQLLPRRPRRRQLAPDVVADYYWHHLLLAIIALGVLYACLSRRNQPALRAVWPSSYAAVVHASTKNHTQKRSSNVAPDAAVKDDDYWSGLPDDLLFTIMASLDVPSLRRAGAVCTSWRAAHDAFRLPALERAPCLLYACEEYGPNEAALYCPSTRATFRVPFPGPPHEKRGFTFACHGGWGVPADEVGDPYLLNPVTGARAMLPPVKTIYHNDEFYDDDGRCVWPAETEYGIMKPTISWARHSEYLRVAISAAADVTECTVVILHMPEWRLSFARPGDDRWTLVSKQTSFLSDIFYNDKNGLFYILGLDDCSVSTLDLSGPSPSVNKSMRGVAQDSCDFLTKYLTLGPSGEPLEVWRNWSHTNTPLKDRQTYHDIVNKLFQDCVDLANEDGNNNKPSDYLGIDDHQELEPYEANENDQEIDASELLREGIDLPHRLVDEVITEDILVFKVDVDRQKLVELRDIGDHTLFVGLNSVVCLPTKDFPAFEPNCAYLTDDCFDYSPMLRKDIGIWNIKNRSMQKLSDAWPNMYPWLHLPAPVWITPRF